MTRIKKTVLILVLIPWTLIGAAFYGLYKLVNDDKAANLVMDTVDATDNN